MLLIKRNIRIYYRSKLSCNVTVSAGVHIDNAKKNDIEVLDKNIKKIIRNLEAKISDY